MYYSDIHNVPRKFSRYVCWNTQVVPIRGHTRPLPAIEAPYSNYYAQTDHDEGYVMKTDIPVSDVSIKCGTFRCNGRKIQYNIYLKSN